MDNKLQHILEKLRKLVNLKASATECGELGEANAAAAGITRLLKEYDLTLQDIPAEEKVLDPVDIEPVPFRFTYMQHKWYWALMDVLARFNSCEIIRSRKTLGGKVTDITYKVIGRTQNRKVVLYLISFCAHQFLHIGKSKYAGWKYQYMLSTGRIPPPLATYMKSFLAGCVNGLYDKLKAEQADLPEEKVGALVVADKTAITEFMKDMDVKAARNRPIKVDREILREGCETGRHICLSKGIEEKTAESLAIEGNSGISNPSD